MAILIKDCALPILSIAHDATAPDAPGANALKYAPGLSFGTQ